MFAVLRRVADRLNPLGIDWILGGSLASMLIGEVRYTKDIDIAVQITVENVDGLVASFADGYYVDRQMIVDAIRHTSSFNVIDYDGGMKIDIFVQGEGLLDRMQSERRQRVTVEPGDGGDPYEVWIGSPEDQILRKLDWFRRGGEVSDQQWRDIAGMIAVAQELDTTYLSTMADELGLDELVDRALADEAGR